MANTLWARKLNWQALFWRPDDRASWCVLIIKPNRYTDFSNLFFGNKTLHVLDSSCFHHQEFFIVHTAMVYVIQGLLTACEQDQDGTAVPSWSCSQAVSKTCMTYNIVMCTMKNSWWWTQELSETCRVLFTKNKFEKLVHIVGFVIRLTGPMFSAHGTELYVTEHSRRNTQQCKMNYSIIFPIQFCNDDIFPLWLNHCSYDFFKMKMLGVAALFTQKLRMLNVRMRRPFIVQHVGITSCVVRLLFAATVAATKLA